MNDNLRLAGLLSIFCLLVFGYAWQHSSSRERYSPIVEAVQDKVVMVSVPTIMEQTFFVFDSSGMSVHTATVAVSFSGSGVFVTPRGHILTCAHVVDHELRSPIIATLSNGTTAAAFVVFKDTTSDLALLKVALVNTTYASLSLRPLRLGQEVIAVGNPMSQSFSTTHGIISHIGRDLGEEYTFTQTDAPINPGNSGGPLFNLQGGLIGITARKFSGADGLGLAIAPYTIDEFLSIFQGV